jgi:glutathione synthase/RimK-type ligase-like ATP-grasp enzyme
LNTILIITNSADPHADAVINKIKNSNLVYRVNTDELLKSFSFDVQISNNLSSCGFTNPLNHFLDINDVSCIYYRRPEKPSLVYNDSYSQLVVNEAWHGLFHLLLNAQDKKWLGHPHRDKYASSRIVQLNTAKKIGWKVPPTIISKDASKIKKFATQHPFLAIKPLGEKGITINEIWVPYFTSKLNASELLEKSIEDISATYNYLQAYIEKKNEWRITVIGDEVFPCIIHSQDSEAAKTDWRTVDFNSIIHEKGIISKKFERELIQFLKELKLPFGAFDFILTPDDEFVFLECNPNGQWLWIEDLIGSPIAEAIAKWLEANHHD